MSNSIGIRRILLVGTFAFLGLGLLPASASAITFNRTAVDFALIQVTAAPGEVNNFDMTRTGTFPTQSYTFTETGANSFSLTGAAGCTASDSSPPTITVTCVDTFLTAEIFGVEANLGNGDDDFNASTIAGNGFVGGTDNFTINGEDGNDVIVGAPRTAALDTFMAGNGNDRMTGLAGPDNYYGGDGIDRAVLSTGATSGATVTLDAALNDTDGHAENANNIFSDVESITGTPFDDTLTGNCTVANTFTGLGGNDTLQDPASCNTTEFFGGGAGNDTFIGQGGADTVTYTANTAAQAINVTIGGGGDTDGLGGTDTISADIETIFGTPGNDTISGSAAPVGVTLWGRLGNDTILGSGFNDVIRGEAGNDALNCQGGTNDMYVIDPADVPPATNCETPIGG